MFQFIANPRLGDIDGWIEYLVSIREGRVSEVLDGWIRLLGLRDCICHVFLMSIDKGILLFLHLVKACLYLSQDFFSPIEKFLASCVVVINIAIGSLSLCNKALKVAHVLLIQLISLICECLLFLHFLYLRCHLCFLLNSFIYCVKFFLELLSYLFFQFIFSLYLPLLQLH